MRVMLGQPRHDVRDPARAQGDEEPIKLLVFDALEILRDALSLVDQEILGMTGAEEAARVIQQRRVRQVREELAGVFTGVKLREADAGGRVAIDVEEDIPDRD